MDNLKRRIVRIAYVPDDRINTLSLIDRSFIPFLTAASHLYKFGLAVQRHLYKWGIFAQKRLAVPVISVGNLTWGGNGKTPMTEFLSLLFVEAGICPLILTRGYAGGDEAKMLQRHLLNTSVKIGSGPSRATTAASFFQRYGVMDCHRKSDVAENICQFKEIGMYAGNMTDQIGIVILDDGMQISNEKLQNIKAMLKKVLKEEFLIFCSRMVPCYFFRMRCPSLKVPLDTVHNMVVLCVSGIGCPESFSLAIQKLGASHVDQLDFSDHHVFHDKDLRMVQKRLQKLKDDFGESATVILTEKDYDRSQFMLTKLEAVDILVLHSTIQIFNCSGKSEASFKLLILNKVIEQSSSNARSFFNQS